MTRPSTVPADDCQRETENFLRQRPSDPQYCFELFIRAFRHGESAAFHQLLGVYRGLVIHWAQRHSLYGAVQAYRQDLPHYVFSKMWRSTRGERFTFESLPAILGYLRDCIDAALCEMYRDFVSAPARAASFAPDAEYSPADDAPDFELLWNRICELLPEAPLRRLVWLSFVCDYKPEALCEWFPTEFPDRDEIRVLKQKALRRLRKDPVLRRWFGLPEEEL